MEWNTETEIFILFIYYLIPAVIIGGVLIGLIVLLSNLIKSKNKRRKKWKPGFLPAPI